MNPKRLDNHAFWCDILWGQWKKSVVWGSLWSFIHLWKSLWGRFVWKNRGLDPMTPTSPSSLTCLYSRNQECGGKYQSIKYNLITFTGQYEKTLPFLLMVFHGNFCNKTVHWFQNSYNSVLTQVMPKIEQYPCKWRGAPSLKIQKKPLFRLRGFLFVFFFFTWFPLLLSPCSSDMDQPVIAWHLD